MPIKNLASGTLAESVSASTTTLLVYVGEGGASTIKAVWPDTPFYASIMPANPSAGVPNSLDSEIVKVTAVSNDQVGNTALTVARAQRGTSSKAFTAGAIVSNADYAEDAVLVGDVGTPVAVYEKQLYDKDGNTIYPDVGLNLDAAVYSDDPTETIEEPSPWIGAADIIWSQMIDKIYPVGSIFMSATLSTTTRVENALGGTWEKWGVGRVPVGVDTKQKEFITVEKTGGEITHTLTVDEIPSHSHTISSRILVWDDGQTGIWNQSTWGTGSIQFYGFNGLKTLDTGGDQAHNNLQPYITCYMYKRIA